jgi:hypothetical protein
MINKFATILIALFLTASVAQPAYASGSSAVNFGSCGNPQFKLSQENSGKRHGVVKVGTFSGVDTVYKSGNNALQCLCVDTGKGYETKWLDASRLSQSAIKDYKSKGWILVPTGSSWGLKDVPYLAKNSEYSCKSEVVTPTKDILGLASTGNIAFIYLLALVGSVSLITGLVLSSIKPRVK